VIYLNDIHRWMQRKKCFSSWKRLNRVFVTPVIEIMPWILRSYSKVRPTGAILVCMRISSSAIPDLRSWLSINWMLAELF
jgi:hypothetical protein